LSLRSGSISSARGASDEAAPSVRLVGARLFGSTRAYEDNRSYGLFRVGEEEEPDEQAEPGADQGEVQPMPEPEPTDADMDEAPGDEPGA